MPKVVWQKAEAKIFGGTKIFAFLIFSILLRR